MLIFKKLLFGGLFLIFYSWFVYVIQLVLGSGSGIFNFSIEYLYWLIEASVLLLITATLFTVSAILASDWLYVLPICLLSLVPSVIFMPADTGYLFGVGVGLSGVITYATLSPKFKTYLNFSASQILGPSIKLLVMLVTIIVCFVYYLNIRADIKQNGFEIPDSIIDTAMKFSPTASTDEAPQPAAQLPISQDQINELKQNPSLLKQYGVDPKILDTIGQPTKSAGNTANDLIKKTVKDQTAQMIKPYLGFIAPILAVLFYFTISSITSLLSILTLGLLWLIFYILKQTGYIHFDKEMREVLKLVV